MALSLSTFFKDFFLSPISLGTVEFPFHLLSFILTFLLPAAIVFVVYRLIMWGLKRILGNIKGKESVKSTISRVIRIILRVAYMVVLILLISRLLGGGLVSYLKVIYSILNQPLITTGDTAISIITIILIIPIFYIAGWAGKAARASFSRLVLNKTPIPEARKFSIGSIVRYSVLILVVIVGLSIVGINLSSLAVLFGVLGIGLGFGLQNVVGNIFAGIIIIFSRPIKEDDRILFNDIEGTVTHIRLLSSVITTLTNETIIVPNRQLVDNAVHNYSFESPVITITNEVQVSYGSDLDKVVEILREIGSESPHRATNQDISVRVSSFGDSGIQMTLLVMISHVKYKYDAKTWINLEIWRRFKREGIEIPFTQLEVRMK